MQHLAARPIAIAIATAIGVCIGGSAQAVQIESSNALAIPATATPDATGKSVYIVRLKDPAVAMYDGSVAGYAAIPRDSALRAGLTPRNRLDVRSTQAQAYASYLESRQASALGAIRSVIARPLTSVQQMRFALNAVVLELTPAEAAKVGALADVISVEADRQFRIATDISPAELGATNIWSGQLDRIFANGFEDAPPAAGGVRGEGVVVGILDTGVNPESPSFVSPDPSGYAFTNPLGAGTYLGLCAAGGSLAGRCNDKLIGIFNSSNDAGNTGDGTDGNGHGSHTASTAAGNTRAANYFDYSTTISGMAPHANVISFQVCDANGGCNAAFAAMAVDAAIATGIVDVLNFSISGGARPWNDSTSQAFLAATNAGIFVAAAAGNTSAIQPSADPGSVNHASPWVTTVAATTHSGGPAAFHIVAGGTGAPAPIAATPGVLQVMTAGVPSTGLAPSPTYGGAGDGCSAFASGAFTGKIALLKFSASCATSVMAVNAADAGAVAIVIAAIDEVPIASGAQTPEPVFTILSSQGDALKAYATASANPTASVNVPSGRAPAQADQRGLFSLRGPTPWDILKPDISMPGVDILAATKAGSATNTDTTAIQTGTSMASPHAAGAAALLFASHPDWTPAEVRSALMLTAKTAGLTGPGGSGVNGALDRGSGRGQIDVAARSGLVLDETAADFTAANPIGGTLAPADLNLASMLNRNCVTVSSASSSTPGCAFTRTFRSTASSTVTYAVSLETPVAGVTLSTSSLVVAAGSQAPLTVTVAGSALSSTFFETAVVLTPDSSAYPTLHLPLLAALQPPQATPLPAAVSITIPSGNATAQGTTQVSNAGGTALQLSNLAYVDSTPRNAVVLDLPTFSVDVAAAMYSTNALINAVNYQSFHSVGGALSRVSANLVTSQAIDPNEPTSQEYHFWISADDNGRPSGGPGTTGTALWSAVVPITSTALSFTPQLTNTDQQYAVSLNLNDPSLGQSAPQLPPGRYWIGVARGGDLFFAAFLGGGRTLAATSPFGTDAPAWSGVASIFGNELTAVSSPGLSVQAAQDFNCSAPPPGVTATVSTLTVGGKTSQTLTFTANRSQIPVGQTSVSGHVCLQGNDPTNPVIPVLVNVTLN